ncbi:MULTISPECIES: methyl-accepting chemotaxis protein [Brenneria]|uniref:HAMP domain-containing protein n=1 Tax=Brenneria nigrifluens DSM 30175 = ATCC 13028 TaxID=1121120 RepID=A0A2U1UUX1_9GAMM|nr:MULTISPECIES: methyl-accepting chemotaxis protein [Brenneria]EHD22051.1 methyl-accepting chemotaxis sensory transducer [Brenneria sp. EniD312]PWC25381.1 methyl-accepting chemotaxis protein [Brenneria nigrifluens DSM 30175 = ATCC 13028]QCR05133.1 HAMP domain-containing protein [Brenneria nigrifluens DSM 30175 = ATCC 13028]
MFRRIRISTCVFLLLMVFFVMQLVSSSFSFNGFRIDYQNFTQVNVGSQQRDALTMSWVALLQTRNTLNRAATRAARNVAQEQVSVLMTSARTYLAQADAHFKQYLAVPRITDKGVELTGNVQVSYEKLQAALAELIVFLDSGQLQPFLDQPTQSFQDNFEADFSAYVEYINGHLQVAADSSRESYSDSKWSFGIVVTLSLLITLLGLMWLKKALLQPLETMREHFELIAGGNLAERIADFGRNEIGVMFSALQKMQASLAGMVHSVRQGTDAMLHGVQEIAAGNDDLSSRTEEQASALEETAASMEQLTSIVKQNADNAHQAAKLARQTSVTAQKGGEITGDVVTTMQHIALSSQKISDITSVIDGIAFQTNILALNAAVEAARAGEQGRGFAVVAGEVRSLAQRSAQAAKEIKGLIDESVSRVRQGSDLVESAGSTMSDIVRSVAQVTDIMGEIASASDEQSRGIEQVAQAVTEMDGVTQQNAALVEQASSAVRSLAEQAGMLANTVSVFNLASARDEYLINDSNDKSAIAVRDSPDWKTA